MGLNRRESSNPHMENLPDERDPIPAGGERFFADDRSVVHVLHLEEHRGVAQLIDERLAADSGESWRFTHVKNRAHFEAALRRGYDLILIDCGSANADALAAIRQARQQHPEVPIIVVSGELSEEETAAALAGGASDVLAAIEAGATDFVFKQRLQRLPAAVGRALAEARERRRRREAERRVRSISGRLRELAESSRDIFWMTSLDPERIQYVSPSVEHVWGLPRSTFYSDPRAWSKSIHADDQSRIGAAFEAWLDGRTDRFTEEYRVVRPDGTIRWVEAHATWLVHESGRHISGIARDVTERKVAEMHLRESEQRFRATFEQAAVGMAFLDFDGRRLRVNQRYCEIVGYSEDELMSQVPISHPDDRTAAAERRELLLSGRSEIARDLRRYVRKDGTIVWCDITNSLIRDADNRPAYIASVIQDVTDRIQARERLASVERLLQSAISSMAEGLIVQDAEGRILRVNPSAERILGLSAEHMLGRSIQDPAFPTVREDGTPFAGPDRPSAVALRTGLPQKDVVVGVYRRGGGVAWLSINAEPLFGPGRDKPDGVVSTFRDITKSKEAAEEIRRLNANLERTVADRTRALNAESEKLRGVLDTAADAIITIDETGVILSFNRGAEVMTGYRAAEIAAGCHVKMLMTENDARLHDEGLRRYLRGSRPRVIGTGREVTVRRKDGSTFPARLMVSEGRSPEGRFFTGILHDITDFKRRERDMLRLNADLERRAAEAEEAKRDIESFSYSVSHDLRAPLHAIQGFAEALAEEHVRGMSAEGRHFLERIRESGRRMDQLIEDMMALARISRTELAPHAMDFTALANDLLKELRNRDPARPVRFDVQRGMVVHGDESLMRIALANLLGNAWKFSSRRAETVIYVARASLTGRRGTFFVRDEGAGFDPAYASKLFNPFQRLHSESEFEGTGIGLATVRRVMERHGGSIWARGVPDGGATFYFTLPVSSSVSEAGNP